MRDYFLSSTNQTSNIVLLFISLCYEFLFLLYYLKTTLPNKYPIPTPKLAVNTWKPGLKSMPKITPIAQPKIIPNDIKLSIKLLVSLDLPQLPSIKNRSYL